jgi:aspartate kinase
MLEASSNGAKVLHNRCVSLAKKYKVKIISKNTFNNSLGSTVQDTSEDLNVHFITKKENLTKICIVGSLILENSNVLNNIYTIANKLNTKIYMITTNELSINIIVDTAIANSFIQELHNTLIIKEE